MRAATFGPRYKTKPKICSFLFVLSVRADAPGVNCIARTDRKEPSDHKKPLSPIKTDKKEH